MKRIQILFWIIFYGEISYPFGVTDSLFIKPMNRTPTESFSNCIPRILKIPRNDSRTAIGATGKLIEQESHG